MIQTESLLVGVGLRSTHYPYLETRPAIKSNWFEAITENYLDTEGRPLEMLLRVRADYPIALHGVSLSIGSDYGINENYLKKLKKLVERADPLIVSDHLCWTNTPSGNSHDLLPLPLTRETFDRLSENIDIVQNYLERHILLENISYYLKFTNSELDEASFITELCKSAGCKILLDINNVYVNSVNHEFDPLAFIEQIPEHAIGQIHLAGPSQEDGYLFDTHSTSVPNEVWNLFKHISRRNPNTPVIIEWDQDIPPFETLEQEVDKTRSIAMQSRKC